MNTKALLPPVKSLAEKIRSLHALLPRDVRGSHHLGRAGLSATNPIFQPVAFGTGRKVRFSCACGASHEAKMRMRRLMADRLARWSTEMFRCSFFLQMSTEIRKQRETNKGILIARNQESTVDCDQQPSSHVVLNGYGCLRFSVHQACFRYSRRYFVFKIWHIPTNYRAISCFERSWLLSI